MQLVDEEEEWVDNIDIDREDDITIIYDDGSLDDPNGDINGDAE